MPEVKCSVSNCNYWAKGNNCGADSIAIDIDGHSNAEDVEFAEEWAHSEHQDHATTSSTTCCQTFKPKH